MADDKKKETVKLSHHRVVMHLHKGGLHKWAGVPMGEKIPEEKVQEAINSDNPHVAAMGRLAHTFSTFNHDK
jgi:hypothetical protein